jgi:hypothetical protein
MRSFPQLETKDVCGKGDGEGNSLQDNLKKKSQKKTEKTKVDGLNVECVTNASTPSCSGTSTARKIKKSPGTMLSDFQEVDTVVLQLYDMFTRDPCVMVQMQIDRYLFAASALFVEECGGDIQTCVLHECQVPCIFNLPDIVFILRQRLTHGSWANVTQETVCRYTIPGMQKSRWVARQRKVVPIKMESVSPTTVGSKRAQTSGVDVSPEAEDPLTSVYINIMLGLLLGLYPQCSKRPGFTMRIRIVRAVRALLSSSYRVQLDFITKHVSLLRLSMVEYFANIITLYCPVEFKMLQRHVDVDSYVNLCRSSCDLFRVNNLSEGLQQQKHNKPLDWAMLDQLAYKMTDKIIRSTRVETKLVNYTPLHHKSIKKIVVSDIYKQPESCRKFLSLVKGCAVSCWHDDHSYMYQRMLSDVRSTKGSQCGETEDLSLSSILDMNIVVSDVHSILRATMLPANFVREQIRTLCRLYEHDTVKLMVVTKKRVCLHCLIRIAPKQFVLEEQINGNIRMNLDTDTFFCNRCMSSEHMISIDLVGRILRINEQYLYLCPECGAIHEWKSDGCDLLRCPDRMKQRLKLCSDSNAEVTASSTKKGSHVAKCRTHCFVCSKLCTGNGLWLLHVASLRMIHFDLCSIHLPPLHMTPYVIDTADYQRWLVNMSTLNNSRKRKKRRC